jgi:hypothetical protein
VLVHVHTHRRRSQQSRQDRGSSRIGRGLSWRWNDPQESENDTIRNLTTAAAIWFAAAIGMAIGIGWYVIAVIASTYAVIVPRIPHVKRWMDSRHDE